MHSDKLLSFLIEEKIPQIFVHWTLVRPSIKKTIMPYS